jgi:hypothetical protein
VESSEKVHAEIARLSDAGLFTEEQIATTCCFATQDKVWVTGPNKERWEVYTVLADTEHFGTEPRFAGKDDEEAVQACCGTGGRGEAAPETAAESKVACCGPQRWMGCRGRGAAGAGGAVPDPDLELGDLDIRRPSRR